MCTHQYFVSYKCSSGQFEPKSWVVICRHICLDIFIYGSMSEEGRVLHTCNVLNQFQLHFSAVIFNLHCNSRVWSKQMCTHQYFVHTWSVMARYGFLIMSVYCSAPNCTINLWSHKWICMYHCVNYDYHEMCVER